jgi:hypothetical protein
MKLSKVLPMINCMFKEKDTLKDPKFAILLVKNKKIKKKVQGYKGFYWSNKAFTTLKDLNKTVFPRKYVQGHAYGANKSSLEILLVKKRDIDNDSAGRIVMTALGPIVENVKGNWDIIDKFEYQFEETFKVYGVEERYSILQILANIFLERLSAKNQYDVYEINAKIYITDWKKDDIIFACKCKNDALRMYNFLINYFHNLNCTKFFFNVEPPQMKKREIKKRILEKTCIPKDVLRHSNMG